MSAIDRLTHQAGFDLLTFRRNPAATFFTVGLPLIFLVIFNSIFGDQTLENGADASTVYVPGILAIAITSATGVNLAITMTTRRERGMLKRLRGTPIPPWVFVVAQTISAFVISAAMAVIIVIIGRILYGVELFVAGMPSLVITVLIGSTSLAAIGLALTAIIPSEDAAPAVTNAIFLPLYFMSGIFIPSEQAPDWVNDVGAIFPIAHLANALGESFDPTLDGTPWPLWHWLVIALWGVGAAVVTLRFFRWTPRR